MENLDEKINDSIESWGVHMKLFGKSIVYSPTDLFVFFRSPYVSWLRHHNMLVTKDEVLEPVGDAQMDLLSEKGTEFEKAEFKRRSSVKGITSVEIKREDDFAKSFQATLRAMTEGEGADLIYQGALKVGDFEGYTDFLVKIPGRKSKLGNYSYEVYDTKLARRPKPEYALQIACYNEMLAEILGAWPEQWHLILGDGTTKSFLVSDYRHYYAYFKNVFLEYHAKFNITDWPTPAPWENVTGYEDHVRDCFENMDHICLVAGVRESQIAKFKTVKVLTRADLAKAKDGQCPKKMQPHVFERLREQASLQIKSDELGEIQHRILDHEKDMAQGLARLPVRDEGDVIFDMEGYPFMEEGFEYMFGVLYSDKGKWNYKDFTATDLKDEKKVFVDFMKWLVARFKKFPKMHVYHYADYEKTALSSLSSKYSCMIPELDLLLYNQVLVDLYQVVKEGVRVGTSSYSLKKIEALYDFKRSSSVTTAGDSVVQFHEFLQLRDAKLEEANKILEQIIIYNKEDVDSTRELLDWLHGEKKLEKIKYVPTLEVAHDMKPRPTWESLREEIMTSPPKWVKSKEDQRVNQLVGDVIGYFDREDRPVWWAYFNRRARSAEDLYDDAECLALAQVVDVKNGVCKLKFDPDQELKIKVGAKMLLHGSPSSTKFEILNLDCNKGTASVNFGSLVPPDEVTLYPGGPFNTDKQKMILEDMGQKWLTQAADKALTGPILDLLYRRPPKIDGIKKSGELYAEGANPLAAALKLALNLKNSCLSLQGPPGTGKTFAGAHIICHLLKNGKRVAVVAQARKTVEHLLGEVFRQWKELYPKDECPPILMADNDLGGPDATSDYKYLTNTNARKKHGQFRLLGATHYVYSSEELQNGSFHYLFIEEAGQFSLATAIACSYVAENMILLGDQMQLEQVNVGTHPGDSGLSVLNYYMKDQSTIPRTHGVFLEETWRMHPNVCEFISKLVYENRLASHKRTHAHVLDLPATLKKTFRDSGISFVSVDHFGNAMRSQEEVDQIAAIIEQLRKTKVPDGKGGVRKFNAGPEDLILITPFNAQVELIRANIPDVKVGTVDLFQGQEAWVSILSMCASGEEGLHRGLEFLLSKNRVNVGLSRAKALSIVVGSPRLMEIRPRRIGTIPLLNFYAALMGYGSEDGAKKKAIA